VRAKSDRAAPCGAVAPSLGPSALSPIVTGTAGSAPDMRIVRGMEVQFMLFAQENPIHYRKRDFACLSVDLNIFGDNREGRSTAGNGEERWRQSAPCLNTLRARASGPRWSGQLFSLARGRRRPLLLFGSGPARKSGFPCALTQRYILN